MKLRLNYVAFALITLVATAAGQCPSLPNNAYQVAPKVYITHSAGAMYGNRREELTYLVCGHRRQSQVENYDYYTDSINRHDGAREIRYFHADKNPKLVAVEKYENITFYSNYEIQKLGCGVLRILDGNGHKTREIIIP